jgi:hypothetical protein
MDQRSDVGFVNVPVQRGGFWQGFVPCPMALFCGMTPEQILWQEQLYQRAYTKALAAVGATPLDLPVYGPEARN